MRGLFYLQTTILQLYRTKVSFLCDLEEFSCQYCVNLSESVETRPILIYASPIKAGSRGLGQFKAVLSSGGRRALFAQVRR